MKFLFLTLSFTVLVGLSDLYAIPGPCGDVCAICANNGDCDTEQDCLDGTCAACIDANCGETGVPINSYIVWLLVSGVMYGVREFKNGSFRKKA